MLFNQQPVFKKAEKIKLFFKIKLTAYSPIPSTVFSCIQVYLQGLDQRQTEGDL